MLVKIDKEIILENLGIQTRPPVVQTAPGTPTFKNHVPQSNSNSNSSSSTAGKLPTQNLNSFADNQQQNESNFTKSAGLRFLNHMIQQK